MIIEIMESNLVKEWTRLHGEEPLSGDGWHVAMFTPEDAWNMDGQLAFIISYNDDRKNYMFAQMPIRIGSDEQRLEVLNKVISAIKDAERDGAKVDKDMVGDIAYKTLNPYWTVKD